jgi:outer membrane usher protein
VPGVAGVHGYLNNQDIGVTDSHGDLPVPNLLAYYGNRVAIADTDVPLVYSVGATERTVSPGLRGGALIAFPVRRVQSLSGRVVVEREGATRVPAYGDLRVEGGGGAVSSPIGRDGEFYLENLPPGRHRAVIEEPEGTCAFTLEAPAVGPSLVDLGTLVCSGEDR